MNFSTASIVESLTWQMRLADQPRSQNRARINDLFNGCPPYSADEERQNNVAININHLEGTKLAHDARAQLANALLKPGVFFTARTDMGPVHKRAMRSAVITNEINKIMKGCPRYFETMRAKFAQLVLHGIAPSVWETRETWCPDPIGIEDVMMPSNTLITFKNLPFFALFRAYTAEELYRLTHGPKRDPGWQMDNVNAVLKWADEETARLSGTTWPQVWSPEKMSERIKEDSGLYASDAVPTIDTWHFFFWNDSGKVAGWNKRIVLDGYGQPGVGGVVPDKNLIGGTNQFLYDPGDRKYGSKISEIVSFQFADLSAVAPFRYHSVRSLGFLLYAVCHLQNRLRCKFNEAVFEAMMIYMRVKSLDEAERALKINLISRGIIDETVQFLKPDERWQVNERLALMGIQQNQQIINENSSSYVQSQGKINPDVEKTAFQVRAELNATTALIGAALLQAYQYQTFEYNEIFRRFCIKNSSDPDVRSFRLNCLKRGVPENMLEADAWQLEPERIMGNGNKSLELNAAQMLMEWRPLYDPEAQREILRTATLAATDDPGMTASLVPDNADKVTNSKQSAMLAMGSLMLGLPVKFGPSDNRIEITETLLAELAMVIQRLEQNGQMASSQQELIGLQNVIQTIGEQLQILGQDPSMKEKVKAYGDDLGKLSNIVKAYGQRLAEQQQKAGQNGQANGEAAAEAAKIKVQLQGQQLLAETKAKNASESHAQKTAQRQVSFEMKERQQQQSHEQEIQRQLQQDNLELQKEVLQLRLEAQKHLHSVRLDEHAKDIQTAAEIKRQNAKAAAEPKTTAE